VKNSKKIALGACAFLLISSLANTQAVAAVKAGSSCPKAGKTTASGGKTFTCIKSGKKLVWNKGVAFAKDAATVTPAPSQSTAQIDLPKVSSSSDFADTNECKLGKPSNIQMDDGPMGSVGFPKNPNAFSSIGNIKALVIFVDFPDVVASSDLKTPWLTSSIPNAEKLFAYSSYGKFKVKVDTTNKIYRMSKKSTYYELLASPSGGPLPGSPPPKIDEVILDAMELADPDVDFTQYAFAVVSTPESPNLAISGASGLGPNPKKFDGVTYNYGDFMPLDSLTPLEKPYRTLNFTHDIGHMLGLMHPYQTGGPITGQWDIMWSFSFQNDFLGWNKWKLDWITDDQVSCLNGNLKESVTQLLSPIGVAAKSKKMVVIKLTSTTSLAIEVRRKSPFEDLKQSDEGVIVYTVDTTKSQGQGPYKIISNPQKMMTYQNFPGILGTMKPGESVTEQGYVISVLASSSDGDYVSVKKAS
jgi:M6 family metalloprotease-like protein